MDAVQANLLLGRAASVDPRAKSQVDRAEAWAETLWDVSLVEAYDALAEHQRNSTEPPLPAHILAIVKRNRRTAQTERDRALQSNPQTARFIPGPSVLGIPIAEYGEALNSGDPQRIAQARSDYDDALRAAGYTPREWDGRPVDTWDGRGQGKDFAIPVGDR